MEGSASKREILQAILDKEEELWIIMKPSRFNPTDPDDLCIFQNPAEHKEARIEIPNSWFENREFQRIEEAVQTALQNAQIGYRGRPR